MKNHRKKGPLLVFGLPLLAAAVSLGCSLSGRFSGGGSTQAGEASFPTRTPMPTFTPTAESAAFVQATPINAEAGEAAAVGQAPSPTPEPATPTFTPEPTATPDNTVSITFVQNMNVRSGPGTNYAVVGAGTAGVTVKVIGRNPDNSWLQIEFPDAADGVGWIYTELVDVKGAPEAVEVAQAPPPPPPTPTPVPPPPEEQAPAPAPETRYQFTPTGWFASPNAAIVHFKGRIKDEGGNLVNGYSVLLDNWAYSVISHPTGPSHWYPEKGPGEWDVSGIPLGDAVGWWYLSVVRYECPGFFEVAFDAQCKQFTRLSEEVPIEVVYPDETVINADWVCHWDCDKGVYSALYQR